MDEAYKLVLTVTEEAPEVKNAEDSEYPLEEERKNSHVHQVDTYLLVVILNISKLF